MNIAFYEIKKHDYSNTQKKGNLIYIDYITFIADYEKNILKIDKLRKYTNGEVKEQSNVVPVINDFEFSVKILKTKIRAIGGVKRLFENIIQDSLFLIYTEKIAQTFTF